ncbi:MAG: NIL domain-containing protein [Actinomycetota bacterium]|nr:NIL domain-containing protein [Actinomycetota bacterium]
MASRRLHLTFPEKLITQPVIFELGKRFDVITNIRRANIEEKVGWVILEIEGSSDQIDAAAAHLGLLGVQVSPIEGDVTQG